MPNRPPLDARNPIRPGVMQHNPDCHWTGHSTRLDRFSRFADRKAYAFEELIAEIGNCMICAQLGLTPDFAVTAPLAPPA